MALKPPVSPAPEKQPVAQAVEDKQPDVVEDKQPEHTVTHVQCVQGHGLRHPFTHQMFRPGVVIPVVDLDSPENIFVRHQIDAGVFEIAKG